jgi:hypothetical protein
VMYSLRFLVLIWEEGMDPKLDLKELMDSSRSKASKTSLGAGTVKTVSAYSEDTNSERIKSNELKPKKSTDV